MQRIAAERTVSQRWYLVPRGMLTSTGKGLAEHLDVPLPFLLYRAQARYEEDLRGLQGIGGLANPFGALGIGKPSEPFPGAGDRPGNPRRSSGGLAASVKLSTSVRQSPPTPLAVRGRLNSLGARGKAISSSTLTLRAPLRRPARAALSPPSRASSESGSDTDEDVVKAERAEREQERQAELEAKLANLQLLMTDDALGLVRRRSGGPQLGSSSRLSSSRMSFMDRGRPATAAALPRTSPSDSLRLGRASIAPLTQVQDHRPVPGPSSARSQSVSSASSPHGSIPSIPSPTSESQRVSPISMPGRHAAKSSSPPAVSPRSGRSVRYQALVGRTNASEQGSNYGSTASSFSDISGAYSRVRRIGQQITDKAMSS